MSKDLASVVLPTAWIDFADNGNIRFWTADADRAAAEKKRGRHLRMFTLAELVALAGRPIAADRVTFEQCANVAEAEAARWPKAIGSSAMIAAGNIRALADAGATVPPISRNDRGGPKNG